MHTLLKIKILLFITLFTVTSFAESPKSYFFIFSGQSNMTSRGKTNQIAKELRTAEQYKEIYLWNNKSGKFDDLSKKLPGKFSVAIPFAHTLRKAKPEGKIFMAVHAAGGRPLHYSLHFKPHKDHFDSLDYKPGRDNFFPGLNAEDKNKGKQYITLHKAFTKAQENLKVQGFSTKVDGFIWVQGESDSNNKLSSQTYNQSMEHLKKRVEEDTKTAAIPMVFMKVFPNPKYLDQPRERPTFLPILHKQMEKAAADDNGIYMSLAPADKMDSKFVHYTSQGYWEIGTNLAKAFLKINSDN